MYTYVTYSIAPLNVANYYEMKDRNSVHASFVFLYNNISIFLSLKITCKKIYDICVCT